MERQTLSTKTGRKVLRRTKKPIIESIKEKSNKKSVKERNNKYVNRFINKRITLEGLLDKFELPFDDDETDYIKYRKLREYLYRQRAENLIDFEPFKEIFIELNRTYY